MMAILKSIVKKTKLSNGHSFALEPLLNIIGVGHHSGDGTLPYASTATGP
jgi:hypothetical protein